MLGLTGEQPISEDGKTMSPLVGHGLQIMSIGAESPEVAQRVYQLIANLGASKKVPEISYGEFDNIYIVSIPWFGKTKTIRLRYGEPYIGAADDVRPMAL